MASARREPLVPTLDADVRSALRAAGAPIQCFGEGAPQRRNRLRIVMSDQQWMDVAALFRACNVEQQVRRQAAVQGSEAAAAGGCFSRGPVSLTTFRRDVFQQTIAQAQVRQGHLRMDGIALHQLGSAKIAAQVQAFSAAQLKPMSRRLTVMNVGMERPVGAVATQAEEGNAEGMPSSAIAMRVGFTAVASLPPRDDGCSSGAWIVTGDSAGVVTVWNADTGAPLASRHSHDTGYGRVQGLAAYPAVASGGAHQRLFFFACARNMPTVTMWSVGRSDDDDEAAATATPQLVPHSVPCNELPHRGTFHRVAVDGNGAVLAATSNDCLVRLWDARRLMECANPLTASPSSGATTEQACTPTFVCALDGLVEARRACDVAFHPDGSLVSVTDGAGRCSTWDVRSGKLSFSTWSAPHIFGPASCAVWSPCGLQFATGGTDHIVQLWDARKLCATASAPGGAGTAVTPLLKIAAHFDVITSLSFMPSTGRGSGCLPTTLVGRALCSTSLDGSIHFWDTLQAGARLHSLASSYTEGAVRGHCWTSTAQKALQLVAITTAHHWSSWCPDTTNMQLSGGTMVQHDVVVRRHGDPATAGGVPSHAVGDDDAAIVGGSDSDEDDMSALRNKHHRTDAAGPPPQNEEEDDDDDDMAQLRRK